MSCYLIAFTTPTTEPPIQDFLNEDVFDINNLPMGFNVLYCQEFDKVSQCKPRILRLTRLLRHKKVNDVLPKELISFSQGREFTERREYSWKLDDSIGNCFHDSMDQEQITGGYRSRLTGAVFKDVYFYLTCVEKSSVDFGYLYRSKMQKLFNTYHLYLKDSGGLGNANGYEELYKWNIVKECKGHPDLKSDDFVGEITSWAKRLNNLLYANTQMLALKNFAEYAEDDFKKNIAVLYDERSSVNDRVASFKEKSEKIWKEQVSKHFENHMTSQADERLISDILTCHKPQTYTFYKSTVYDSFCDYLGIEKRKAGLKLSHFYELINNICLPIYREQTELKELIDKEVTNAGYEVNDLLSIQTALYLLSENQLNTNNDNKISIDMDTSKYDKYKKLLIANHNIVLTGAPGTGKTFMAKGIAKKMEAEVGFVQFHPSYDYTDFVEGLRPTSSDRNGNIGFERKDGVFKDFCKRALGKTKLKDTSHICEADKAIQWFLNTQDGNKIKSNRGYKIFGVQINDGKVFLKSQDSSPHQVNLKAVKRFIISNGEDYNREHQTYEPTVGQFILDKYFANKNIEGMKDEAVDDDISNDIIENKENNKPFVFIIDEINRGEISKIFGELFFSIDSGYRGVDGRVKTQYQNLITDKTDTFYEGFYVPDNVYIIETMNDIDRSVESMDFAMRRRFTWVEVTAEDSMDNMGIEGDKRETMTRLNNAIRDTEGLGKDYELGGAYFLGDMPKEERWEYKIEGLLHEYLRGVSNADEKMKKLEAAYYGTEHNDSDAD